MASDPWQQITIEMVMKLFHKELEFAKIWFCALEGHTIICGTTDECLRLATGLMVYDTLMCPFVQQPDSALAFRRVAG